MGDRSSAPIRLVDVDLDGPIEAILPRRAAHRDYPAARILAWREGRPLGEVEVALEDGALPAPALAERLTREFAGALDPVRRDSQGEAPGELVSVIVSTVSRPDSLRSVIGEILAGSHREIELIVVDNSRAGENEAIVAGVAEGDRRVRYLHAARRGSSVARNQALAEAQGEIIAFTDDDVAVSPGWVENLLAAFAADPLAACVTGLILPAELETAAQVWFVEASGFAKGYLPAVFESGAHQRGLFPFQLGAYGSGANFALSRRGLEAIGGFDETLGGGTPTRGGEDLDIFLRVLQAGLRLRYEPAAVVRHPDHRRLEDLVAQQYAYGIGLTSVLTKHFLAGEHLSMLRLAPRGLCYLLSRRSPKNARKPRGYPRRLDLAELAGLCVGPSAYLRSRRQAGHGS